nr:polyprotein [Alphaendornavirus sp.]
MTGAAVQPTGPVGRAADHTTNRALITKQLTESNHHMTVSHANLIFDRINELLGEVKTKLALAGNITQGRTFTWKDSTNKPESILVDAANSRIIYTNTAATTVSKDGSRGGLWEEQSKNFRKPNELAQITGWIRAKPERTLEERLSHIPGGADKLEKWIEGIPREIRSKLRHHLEKEIRDQMILTALDLEIAIQEGCGWGVKIFKDGLIKNRNHMTERELLRNPFMDEEMARTWVNTWRDCKHLVEFDANSGLISNYNDLKSGSELMVQKAIDKFKSWGGSVVGLTNSRIFLKRQLGAKYHARQCSVSIPPKGGKKTLASKEPWMMTADKKNDEDKNLGALVLTGEPGHLSLTPPKLDYNAEPYQRQEGFIYYMNYTTKAQVVSYEQMATLASSHHNAWLNDRCKFYKQFECLDTTTSWEGFERHREQYERDYCTKRDEFKLYSHNVETAIHRKLHISGSKPNPYKYRTTSVMMQDDGGKTLLCKVFPNNITAVTLWPEAHTPIGDASYSHGILNEVAYKAGLATLHTGWPLKWDEGKPIFNDDSRQLMCPYKIDTLRPMPFHTSKDMGSKPAEWEVIVAWMIKVGALDLDYANKIWEENLRLCNHCGREVGHWPPMAAYTPAACKCGAKLWHEYRIGSKNETLHSLGLKTEWLNEPIRWGSANYPIVTELERHDTPINRHVGTARQMTDVPNTLPGQMDWATNTILQTPGGMRYSHEAVRGLREPSFEGIACTSAKFETKLGLFDPHLELNMEWLESQLKRVETTNPNLGAFCITATAGFRLGGLYTINLKSGKSRGWIGDPEEGTETWYLPVMGGRSLASYRLAPYFASGLKKKWICHNGRDTSQSVRTDTFMGNKVAVNDKNPTGYDSFTCYYGPMLFMYWGHGSVFSSAVRRYVDQMHAYSDIYCGDEKMLIDAAINTNNTIIGWQDAAILSGPYQASGHPRRWLHPRQIIKFYENGREQFKVHVKEVEYQLLGETIKASITEQSQD